MSAQWVFHLERRHLGTPRVTAHESNDAPRGRPLALGRLAVSCHFGAAACFGDAVRQPQSLFCRTLDQTGHPPKTKMEISMFPLPLLVSFVNFFSLPSSLCRTWVMAGSEKSKSYIPGTVIGASSRGLFSHMGLCAPCRWSWRWAHSASCPGPSRCMGMMG